MNLDAHVLSPGQHKTSSATQLAHESLGLNFLKTNGQDNISHFFEKHLFLEAFVPGNCLQQILSVAALPIKLELTK